MLVIAVDFVKARRARVVLEVVAWGENVNMNGLSLFRLLVTVKI
jgi:hypothetical protein